MIKKIILALGLLVPFVESAIKKPQLDILSEACIASSKAVTQGAFIHSLASNLLVEKKHELAVTEFYYALQTVSTALLWAKTARDCDAEQHLMQALWTATYGYKAYKTHQAYQDELITSAQQPAAVSWLKPFSIGLYVKSLLKASLRSKIKTSNVTGMCSDFEDTKSKIGLSLFASMANEDETARLDTLRSEIREFIDPVLQKTSIKNILICGVINGICSSNAVEEAFICSSKKESLAWASLFFYNIYKSKAYQSRFDLLFSDKIIPLFLEKLSGSTIKELLNPLELHLTLEEFRNISTATKGSISRILHPDKRDPSKTLQKAVQDAIDKEMTKPYQSRSELLLKLLNGYFNPNQSNEVLEQKYKKFNGMVERSTD